MAGYTLAQLETFLAICHNGTFTAAADQLGLTQPAVSARIHDLEEELGATLFDRRGSRVHLTATGLVVQRHAEAGLMTLGAMRDRVREFDPLRGYLRVGTSSTFATTCLSGLLVAVESQHPELRLELTVSDSRELSRRMGAGQLDVAFLADPVLSADTPVRSLAPIPKGWFAAADSDVAARGVVRPADLAASRVMVNPPPSALYSAVTGWFRDAAIRPATLDTCNSLPITLNLVRAGITLSVMPAWMAAASVHAGEVVALRAQPAFPPMQLCAAYSPTAPDRAVRALISLARGVVADVRAECMVGLEHLSGQAPRACLLNLGGSGRDC